MSDRDPLLLRLLAYERMLLDAAEGEYTHPLVTQFAEKVIKAGHLASNRHGGDVADER